MSEYQYYEFAAIDHAVTEEDSPYPWSVSSRAEVTPWRWRNIYNWGDFRGSVDRMMEFYDAHTYLANWGSFRFSLAFPKDLLDAAAVKAYLSRDHLELAEHGGRCVLTWQRQEEEPGGWQEGEGILDRLIPIREELLRGDYRSLYLGWLAGLCSRDEWEDEDRRHAPGATREPPVPPGLGDLSPALRGLAELLAIGGDYLAAAAELEVPTVDHAAALGDALRQLEPNAMRAYLLRVADGETTRVMTELNRLARGPGRTIGQRRRTWAELLAAVEEQRLARERREAEEREQKRREAAAKRKVRLQALLGRAEAVWTEVDSLAERKTGSAYDEAVRHLRGLRDAYALAGRVPEFERRLREFRDRNVRRSALLSRLDRTQQRAAALPADELTEETADDCGDVHA
jgi:hypothetical protein